MTICAALEHLSSTSAYSTGAIVVRKMGQESTRTRKPDESRSVDGSRLIQVYNKDAFSLGQLSHIHYSLELLIYALAECSQGPFPEPY